MFPEERKTGSEYVNRPDPRAKNRPVQISYRWKSRLGTCFSPLSEGNPCFGGKWMTSVSPIKNHLEKILLCEDRSPSENLHPELPRTTNFMQKHPIYVHDFPETVSLAGFTSIGQFCVAL